MQEEGQKQERHLQHLQLDWQTIVCPCFAHFLASTFSKAASLGPFLITWGEFQHQA